MAINRIRLSHHTLHLRGHPMGMLTYTQPIRQVTHHEAWGHPDTRLATAGFLQPKSVTIVVLMLLLAGSRLALAQRAPT